MGKKMNPLALLVTYSVYGIIAFLAGTFTCVKEKIDKK
jgi:hypothetical protein